MCGMWSTGASSYSRGSCPLDAVLPGQACRSSAWLPLALAARSLVALLTAQERECPSLHSTLEGAWWGELWGEEELSGARDMVVGSVEAGDRPCAAPRASLAVSWQLCSWMAAFSLACHVFFPPGHISGLSPSLCVSVSFHSFPLAGVHLVAFPGTAQHRACRARRGPAGAVSTGRQVSTSQYHRGRSPDNWQVSQGPGQGRGTVTCCSLCHTASCS